MRTQIEPLLARAGGVATRARLLSVLSRAELDDEIRRGRLVAIFPRAYGRPWTADDPGILDRAALTALGHPAALSHVSAVRRWHVEVPAAAVHVMVPARRNPRSIPGRLVVHRRRGPLPPCFRLDGLPVTGLATALVDSWTVLDQRMRRAVVIDATRRGLCTPAEVLAATTARSPGRTDLRDLTLLLAAGCESELEIWGLLNVFAEPGVDHGVRQFPIAAGGRRYRLDLAFVAERVAVELDGWAVHGTKQHREKDARRDAALAAIGWITLRFSYERLTREPAGCRRDLRATLAARAA